jgi:hypothetical protein
MPDYSNAKIYKIYSYENDDVYYGSTVDTLSRRMTGHRCDLKKYKEGKKTYTTSYKILELTTAKIELVENFPCSSKEELLQREAYYIRNNNCVNKCIPGRTHQEWVKDNKDKYNEYQKEYREANKDKNKDKIKEYKKQYDEQNKDKQKEYREQNKDKKKEYYQRKKKEKIETK